VLAFFSGTIAERLSMRATYLISAGLLGVGLLAASLVSEQRARSQDRVSLEGSGEEQEPGAGDAKPSWLPRRGAMWREVKKLGDALTGLFGPGHGVGLPLMPLLVAAFLWSLVTGAVYSLWANYMVQELSYTSGQMSRLWALASLSELPLMILAGWLSDRIGRLPMLSLGFVAWTLVFVGYIFTPQMPWIVGVQLVRGFAYSAFTATAMIYAAEVRQKAQRGQVSGLYASAGGLGSILGMAMGGSLVQVGGFRLMIGVNAALIFGGAVYLAVVGARVRRQALPQG